ncbi:hypothetical protein SEA_GALACTICA_82 [Streptomyces phage Galactica]|nr:hypothetical protein SEA_GALACTICA_82 [Streptomyces phage Galactica]
MATFFHLTDTFNGRVVTEGPRIYTVFTDGAFRGWVSGGQRSFRFFPEGGFEWGPSAITRAKAVDAYYARKAEEDAARERRSQQVPTHVYTARLTADNLADEAPNLVGCLMDGAEDLGEVTNVRLTRDGFNNAMIVGTRGRDVLGLPSTVTAYRV